jgi:hypothetical protein
MEPILFALVFVLILVGYVVLAARASLAEDALWTRQHSLTSHGVCLDLSNDEQAVERTTLLARPPAAERPPVVIAPPEPVRGARKFAAAEAPAIQALLSEGTG